jgi:hypothetical protein
LVQSEQTVLPWWGERWHIPAFVFFLLCSGLAVAVFFFRREFEPAWVTNLVLISGMLTSLVTLARQLPLQNVVMAGVLVSIAAAGWGELTETALDWRGTTWRTTAFWTTVLLNVRGVAQFFLQMRRGTRFYGWELIGGSAWLFTCSVGFQRDILYKPIAVLLPASFFGAVGLFVLLLPLLINKRPVEPPVSWQPIVVLPLLLLWAYLPRI